MTLVAVASANGIMAAEPTVTHVVLVPEDVLKHLDVAPTPRVARSPHPVQGSVWWSGHWWLLVMVQTHGCGGSVNGGGWVVVRWWWWQWWCVQQMSTQT